MRRTIALALVLAAACCKPAGPDWRIAQLYAGEATLEVLRQPTKVQAFRLREPIRGEIPEIHAGPYPAAGPPVDLAPEAAAETSRLLADAASYDWKRTKKEAFRPQVGLWLVRGAFVVEAALDLASGQIAVHAGDQFLGVQSIDPSRDRLLALVKAAFPADPEIAALR